MTSVQPRALCYSEGERTDRNPPCSFCSRGALSPPFFVARVESIIASFLQIEKLRLRETSLLRVTEVLS